MEENVGGSPRGSIRTCSKSIPMNPKPYTPTDVEAFRLAQAKFEQTDPTERYSFQRYLEDAYQHLQARQSGPGEHSDPWAE
jgi:hypothetical protein